MRASPFLSLAALPLALLAFGWALTQPHAAAAEAAATRRVLTSFLPLHSLTLAVAGDRAQVENWLPAGVDPHDFQFSPRDLRRLAAADLLVVAGLGLENWKEDRLRDASGNPRLRIVEAAAHLPADALIHDDGHDAHHDHDHDHGPAETDSRHRDLPNPHFWLDPLLAAHAVTNIARALAAIDPPGTAVYETNAAATVARLVALHREFEDSLRDVRGTAFFTVHNAFPYLARRYGLRLAGVIQRSGNEEPSARELAELSRTAREQNVRVLFCDGKPDRLTKRLAADLKLPIAVLETLEIGDLRPGAYEDGMRRNLRALREALGKGR